MLRDLSQFSDGETIVDLVEAITKETVMTVERPATGVRAKIQNFYGALKFLSQKLGLTLPSIPVPSIINNNLKAIEDMCWDIIYNVDIKPVSYFGLTDRFAIFRQALCSVASNSDLDG